MPKRIQLRRTKGWRKPEGAVVVSRPSKFGNPFRAGEVSPQNYRIRTMDAEHAVQMFRLHMESIQEGDPAKYAAMMAELRGKDLCCWCPPGQACHADVLLEMANCRGCGDERKSADGRP